jgi:hypothetical protein
MSDLQVWRRRIERLSASALLFAAPEADQMEQSLPL